MWGLVTKNKTFKFKPSFMDGDNNFIEKGTHQTFILKNQLRKTIKMKRVCVLLRWNK